MTNWALHDAEARFGEVLDRSQKDGPQVVLTNGEPTAVIIGIRDWERLKQERPFDMKEWLLAPDARGDIPLPSRKEFRLREPPQST